MGRLAALAKLGGSVLSRVVGGAAGVLITGYERSAAQRVASGFSPTLPSGAKTILLFRCLGLVRFSPGFIEALQNGGFRTRTCLFSAQAERRRLLGLKETIAETFESLIVNPPDKPAAIVGSSLGAVASLFVAAPAKLPPPRRRLMIQRLDRLLPRTPHRNVRALDELAERLEGVRVIAMGGPLNGPELTRFGQMAVGGIEMVRPGLFKWLRRGHLRGTAERPGLYRELGIHFEEDAEEVVDLILLGGAQTWGLHGGGPRSLAANALAQGGTRLVSRLAVRRAPGEFYDGVVGHRSALLGLGTGREIVFPHLNHIDMMESREVAGAIVEYLKRG
ncbi:MAG: hypothetical protein HYY44_05450 [Deltaproteobacteria bacterium]|nr:hypothetical protein [Deltaproteobacteria bacterium]MBI4373476.1 hypothetical protein [Deltaproteobacteria bacterium]